MATALELLVAKNTNALTRLAELDALTTDEQVVFTYTEGGRTYGFNEYRASLEAQIAGFGKQVEDQLKAAQMIAGPFTVIGNPGC